MKDGGPAFPAHENWRIESGMSLRDYFAAKAMAMMLHSEIRKDAWANVEAVASDSYKMADAMLEARKK